MSKYVRGVKRNQIIQRWLQGIEDPDYEVFPTKKEGKYIVKLRENPLDSVSEAEFTNQSKEEPEDIESETSSQKNDSIPIVKPRSRTDSTIPIVKPQSRTDSTINLEILEQLRNLGEEIRNDRFKKEQKQYIKQIVNKELNKSRIRSKYVPDLIPACESQQENEPQEAPVPQEPQQEIPKFKSRIRR